MKTKYRNTDLDLISSHPIDQLNQKLEAAGMVVLSYHQDSYGDWNTVLEIIGDEENEFHGSFEATIAAMLDVLEALPVEEQNLLEQCKTREFNAAFDIGGAPFNFDQGLSSETILRMAALKVSFRLTLYPQHD
ncbi:MAG: hypothetical protein AAGA74_02440 [Pseudomonadota bacterium]